MIVNNTEKGWEVIFQRAHGLLAMQLGQFWKDGKNPIRRLEILAAILEHDDGQENHHGDYHLTASGAPKDFKLQDFSLKQAQRVTQTARYKSAFVGLLISMHTSFLYESLRGNDTDIDQFLDLEKEHQHESLKNLGISEKEASLAYNLLQWCDRCSLILCKNELPDGERRLEIFKGPDEKDYFLLQRKDETIQVNPWPFSISEFEAWVEYRELDKMTFKNDEELFKQLDTAEVKIKKWTFRK